MLAWPPQSADLNPMEGVWAHLRRRLAAYPTSPGSVGELWERVEAEWEGIPARVCASLVESMASRIAAVLEAEDGTLSSE